MSNSNSNSNFNYKPQNNDNLFSYIINPEGEVGEDKIRYKNKIKELNLLLTMNNFSEIGDLFDNSLFSVNKTLNVLQDLIEDRQRLLTSKSDILQKISRHDSENMALIEKTEIAKEKISDLNKKSEFLKNKIILDEKKNKEELEKLKSERNEFEKSLNRLIMKESQYKHENKKNEKEIDDLKIWVKRLLGEKEKENFTFSNGNGNSKERDKSPKSPTFNTSKNNYKSLSHSNSNNNIITNSKSSSNTNQDLTLPNMKLTNTISNLLNDTGVKNSENILHSINHFKEFYNLIYEALNEKVNHLLIENEDLKDCYKLIWKEVNQFIEYKKMILYKFSQDSIDDLKSGALNSDTVINFNIFEMDFNDSREEILTNFNEVLNVFRYVLIYDIFKIEPSNEFEFEEIKKQIINKKFEFQSVPYYKQIKKISDSFDFSKLDALKNLIMKSKINPNVNSVSSKIKSIPKDEVFQRDNNFDKNKIFNITMGENKDLESLEEINKDLFDTFNLFEEKFNNFEKELEKAK